jgi:hypothetical protein
MTNRTSSVEADAEQVAFIWFADAHPHEAYAQWPDLFWAHFQTKCPGVTREQMEALLTETAKEP